MHLSKDIDKIASMKCPRKVEDKYEWLRNAQKSIPEIPSIHGVASKWRLKRWEANENRVVFELQNSASADNDCCYVIVDRKASSLA